MLLVRKIRGFAYKVIQKLIARFMRSKKKVSHRGHDFYFSTVSPLTFYRALSFRIKEPETLSWIDSFKNDATFWDVGANIGLYSIYAAKVSNCQVFAFEPSIFNLELLGRNINYNHLSSNISIVPLPLFSRSGFDTFRLTDVAWGGAHSSFSEDIDQDGKQIDSTFDYKVFGISPKDLVGYFGCPQPDHIKIDVDGIEHLILEGLTPILKEVKSVLVEVNEGFYFQKKQCDEIMQSCGFTLVSRNLVGGEMYNQIWQKL